MPARPDMRGALVTPATDAVDRRLSLPGRSVHEASGVCHRMPFVVQHETPELALSYGSPHVLPPMPQCSIVWGLVNRVGVILGEICESRSL